MIFQELRHSNGYILWDSRHIICAVIGMSILINFMNGGKNSILFRISMLNPLYKSLKDAPAEMTGAFKMYLIFFNKMVKILPSY